MAILPNKFLTAKIFPVRLSGEFFLSERTFSGKKIEDEISNVPEEFILIKMATHCLKVTSLFVKGFVDDITDAALNSEILSVVRQFNRARVAQT